ncbi:unnamed protein product [Rotaria magnacalcarata]|uniref:MAM domain-containing protein n=1 Tax=Rotaria magnacalcarata TaxID=392030 RepID=A0A8S2RC92_9BILA|nr:unnamed protein product [Rotaria magnacalcarata]
MAHVYIFGTDGWVFGGVLEAQPLVQNPDASVALDDISITRGLCPSLGDCTFETDLCSWTNNDMDADMDWLVGSGVH